MLYDMYAVCIICNALWHNCQRNYSEKSGSEGSEDDDYVPYVPVKIRKQQMVSNRCYYSMAIHFSWEMVFVSCGGSVVRCHCLFCFWMSQRGLWGTIFHAFVVISPSILIAYVYLMWPSAPEGDAFSWERAHRGGTER